MKKACSRAERAFSLIEVTLALGLISFCVIALVALIPLGAKTNRTSVEETQAICILSALESDLRCTHPALNGGRSEIFGLVLPYMADANGRLRLDPGVPINQVSAATSTAVGDDEKPATTTEGRQPFRVTVIYTSAPAAGSLTPIQARLVVSWPAAPATNADQLVAGDRVTGFVEAPVLFPAL